MNLLSAGLNQMSCIFRASPPRLLLSVVHIHSTLRRRPGYRTLERDLIQLQQQQLFQLFVVVSLRKSPRGSSYSPEITQQFPKMVRTPHVPLPYGEALVIRRQFLSRGAFLSLTVDLVLLNYIRAFHVTNYPNLHE